MKPFTKNLSINSFGTDVLNLQNALEKLGYGNFIPTGFFGTKTRNAVINFQRKNGIFPAIGNFGEKTRAKMNEVLGFAKGEILYETAVRLIGVDASPLDRATDEYGCADTVNVIYASAIFPNVEIGGATQTAEMVKYLRLDTRRFERVEFPKRGDIIISPTEYPRIGHVGIMADEYVIMSNSSSSGTWEKNFNMDTWKARYVNKFRLKMEFYRLK